MEVSFALIHVCFGTCLANGLCLLVLSYFVSRTQHIFLFYVGMNVSFKRNEDGIDNSFITLHAHNSCYDLESRFDD